MQKERKINVAKGETGTCPYCGSDSYDHEERNYSGDTLFYDCTCNDCGKVFNETYFLAYQEWED